jgi:hypothetical protein
MVHESKRDSHNINSLFWGTLILLIGATWLGINIGLIEPGTWKILVKMWPALLIIWGFNIIIARTVLRVLAYLTPLVLVAAFGYAVFYAPVEDDGALFTLFPVPLSIFHDGDSHVGELAEYKYALDDLTGAESIEVQLGMGAAELDVAVAEPGTASVEVRSNVGEPEVNLAVEGNKLVLHGKSPRMRSIIGNIKQEWKVALPPGLPLSFSLDAGASDGSIDLRGTLLKAVDIESGAVDLDLWLPQPDERGYEVNVESGASDLKLRFPANAPVRINADMALVSTNFKDAGLTKSDGYWVSPAYAPGVPFAEVKVSAGAASVSVHFKD